MKDYRIDFVNNTIELSRSFYEASQEFDSEEFDIMMKLKAKLPQMTITVKAPKSRRGHANPYKGLTYSFMRRFIFTLDEANAVNYEKVIKYYQDIYGDDSSEVYYNVRAWFITKYPRYNELITDSIPDTDIKVA